MIELIRLGLAAVFAVAGIAKLLDRTGTRRSLEEFGVPAGLRAPLAALLPVVELGVAAALLPTSTSRPAAAAAGALLVVFEAVVVNSLLRGRRVDCNCFGSLRSGRTGWRAVVRNAVLAVAATCVAVSPAVEMKGTALAGAIAALVLGGQTVLLVALLRRYGRALTRIDELSSGKLDTSAPIVLRDLLGQGKRVLLVFVDPGCAPCQALLPAVSRWQRDLAHALTVAVVSGGGVEESTELAELHDLSTVLVQADELARLYEISATPSAVLLGADGVVLSTAAGAGHIEDLARGRMGAELDGAAAEPRSSAPVRTVAALAGAAFVAAPLATAATGRTRESAAEPEDSELHALDVALRAASPRIVKATRRSSTTVQAYTVAVLRKSRTARAKQLAAARALDAERDEILTLHSRIRILPATTVRSHNAKGSALIGLSYLAQSLQAHRRAILAPKPARARLYAQRDQLLGRALDSIAGSARLLAGA